MKVPYSAVVSSSAVADLFGEARRIYLLRLLLSTWVSRSG
jgi:hypothetical protein